jgi:hypothetical protein
MKMDNWYQSSDARAVHRELRRMKGRSGLVYVRYDERGKRIVSFCEDPITTLRLLRELHHRFPARYGEIRQRVVSQVNLPDLRK